MKWGIGVVMIILLGGIVFAYNFEDKEYGLDREEEVITYNNNTAYVNSSEIWITAEGDKDDVADILTSELTNNLDWYNSTQVNDSTYWQLESGSLITPKIQGRPIYTTGQIGAGGVPTAPLSTAGTTTDDFKLKVGGVLNDATPSTNVGGITSQVNFNSGGGAYTNIFAMYNVPFVNGITADTISATYHNPAILFSTVTNAEGVRIAGGNFGSTITNYKAINIFAGASQPSATNQWAIYSAFDVPSYIVGDIQVASDTSKYFAGLSDDISWSYNGSDAVFNTEVGADVDWFFQNALSYRFDNDIQQSEGNATINLIYGGLTDYNGEQGGAGLVTIVTQGVYHNVTNLSMQTSNGFEFNTTGMSNLEVLQAGVYEINSGWSFSGSASTEYHLAVMINDARQNDCHAERVIGTGGDVGSASTTPCIKQLNKHDNITLGIENVDSTADATIHDIGLTIKWLGN